MFNKKLTLEKCMKKFQKAVANKEFCTLRVEIHTNGKGYIPTIIWEGYINGKGWSKSHTSLKEVIKYFKEQSKKKKLKKGQDIKI